MRRTLNLNAIRFSLWQVDAASSARGGRGRGWERHSRRHGAGPRFSHAFARVRGQLVGRSSPRCGRDDGAVHALWRGGARGSGQGARAVGGEPGVARRGECSARLGAEQNQIGGSRGGRGYSSGQARRGGHPQCGGELQGFGADGRRFEAQGVRRYSAKRFGRRPGAH